MENGELIMEDYKDDNQREFVECFAVLFVVTIGVLIVYGMATAIRGLLQ